MRIAITSDLYYPMSNGVAVFAHNLAKGLASQGHEVLVLCPSFTGKKHRTVEKFAAKRKLGGREGTVTTQYLRSIRFPFYPDQINKVPEGKEFLGLPIPRLAYRHGLWISLEPYLEMKKALHHFKPDVIHNQTAEMVAFAAQRYAKKYNIPMVSTGHAYPDNITSQLKLLKPLKKPLDVILRTYMASFLKHSEYATMPTEMAIEDLVPKNRKRFKVTVEPLSNGVDLSKYYPGGAPAAIYRKYKLPTENPIVLYVGRVDPEKSIGNVVTAFAGVLDEVPYARLVVVGDGTDRQRLMDLAKAMGISDKVTFPGRVMPPDVMEIYRAADMFVTASETETQGIVLIEAAATGLPIVAVDAGAVAEVCRDEENGVLCQPGDILGMTDAMVKILKNEELREQFSKRSLEIAAKHDLNYTLKRFVEIYQEAIRLKSIKKR